MITEDVECIQVWICLEYEVIMMAVLTENLISDINDKSSLKSITAILNSGIPHTVYKGSLHVNSDGNIEFYDIFESSRINEALVNSIWFEKYITVNILTSDKRSFEIIGKPVQSITQGRYFEEVYKDLKHNRNNDLNAIWIIKPENVREETFSVRQKEQEENYPFLKHLDRALK